MITMPLPTTKGGGGGSAPAPSHPSGSSHPSAAPPHPTGGSAPHVVINNHVGAPGYAPRPHTGGLSPYWRPPIVYHPWYHPAMYWPTPSNYYAGNISVLQTIVTIIAVAAIIALVVWTVRSGSVTRRRW